VVPGEDHLGDVADDERVQHVKLAPGAKATDTAAPASSTSSSAAR
jgi:hypothetical protein